MVARHERNVHEPPAAREAHRRAAWPHGLVPATIIAIAGPSGSGKSLLTEHLKHALSQHEATHSRSLAVVCEDAYYHSQAHLSLADRAALNFDHPEALDHDQLERDLLTLRDGHPVNLPVYDYASHTRTSEPIALAAADIVLVEGCLLLSQERIREVVDFSVFVATDLETCLTRRIARDTVERGRTKDSVVEQSRRPRRKFNRQTTMRTLIRT